MVSKVLCFTALVMAVAAFENHHHDHHHHEHHHPPAESSQFLHKDDNQQSPVVIKGHGHDHKHHEPVVNYYAYPKYKFGYNVKDKHTGDIKNQHEERNGNHVSGEYSLHQPDGKVRVVEYTADEKTGFQADVKYETLHHHH